MTYTGPERRRHPRINERFVVSYRLVKEANDVDMAQTKNLSQGGMLLTTNKKFGIGTSIALEIRLPFNPNPILLIGKVLESREVTKNLIYDTRIQFLTPDKKLQKAISSTVDYYLKREKDR